MAYQYQWDLAINNNAACRLKRRLDAFHNSYEGVDFESAVEHLERSIDQNVNVTDIPHDWEMNLMRKPKTKAVKATTNMVHQNSLNHNDFVNMFGQSTPIKAKKAAKTFKKNTFNKAKKSQK